MDIETEYAVNLFFPNSNFLQIYFEALANAFDAGANEINIAIESDGQIDPSHLKITITDNGCGFTDDRYDRFRRVKKPKDRFHKGMGRLVYLRYFSSVNIISCYGDKKRTFSFSHNSNEKSNVEQVQGNQEQKTVISFHSFSGQRLKKYEYLKPDYLKDEIIEHFLPLLYNKKKAGKDFHIKLRLDITSNNRKQKKLYPSGLAITPADIPDFKTIKIQDNTIDAFHEIFINYALVNEVGQHKQLTAACIDDRTILMDLLPPKAIPVNHSAIFLFESTLFGGSSDNSRQKLNLPESISERALKKVLRKEVSLILKEAFPDIEKKNVETKKFFDDRFPHLSGYFEEETVGIIDKDEAIHMAQDSFFTDQRKILESDFLDEKTFKKSLEISSRTLTEYILYRELIIQRLSQYDQTDQEVEIHNLIVPRYKKFQNDSLLDGIYSNNVWLLDDKFMSFRTVLSEARMKDVVSAITLDGETIEDNGRPDISLIFSADPEQEEKVDVVVVELKKKKVDDKEGPYAVTQLLKRARKIIENCPNVQRIWYFGVIGIDESLAQILRDQKWTPLFSKGQVYYQEFSITMSNGVSVPTPICLLSYDAIIKDAASRNNTFLEILKRDIRLAKQAQEKN